MGRPKSISSPSLFVSSELCYICVVHAQVVKKKQTTTVAMLSSQLGVGRAICISRFSHPEFRSLSSKRLCVLCPLLRLHLLSFFLLLFFLLLLASIWWWHAKSCSFVGKTLFFFLGYILPLVLVLDTHTLMLLSLRVRRSLWLFSR